VNRWAEPENCYVHAWLPFLSPEKRAPGCTAGARSEHAPPFLEAYGFETGATFGLKSTAVTAIGVVAVVVDLTFTWT
jgi:hypothetical protein